MPPSRPKRARAAAAMTLVAALGVGAPEAAAAPEPPDTASEAAQRLRDLARKAEVLTEDYKKAQDDHQARQEELARAEAAVARAEREAARARTEERKFRGKADQLTEASYQGARLNKLSALVVSESPNEYLDRAAVLDNLAAEHNKVIRTVARAAREAAAAERRARAARDAAAEAEAEAARLEEEIARRKEAMDEQIAEVEQQYNRLSGQERAALAGSGSTDVGSIAGSGAAVAAVNAALSKQGSPYVWGAKGPNRFDCSGLVQWSYEQAGVSLPASTRTQINAGRAVSVSAVKPGDVVFYYDSASHNGIYIGNGKVVHAPTTGQNVKVEGYKVIGDIHSVRRMAG
ncbi:NlpC/P60 family protein [Halopolyspora algeriensis]|uniref:NlpC/P60 family protein n=1 Tax=Halopolyspora algeriensis TaxID=1500506 RepID=A0A368VRZ0_9ACTN|nr:C40 family peptidase [Halopolyspora algeriensis]RCW44469.1 NlpC/P60 family protein [Halopolyspora algeriensis]TQM55830.1 NlpC/P60 family protein [Halopolyspora algeriensis]